MAATIILLNGAGSAGKSSIARQLQGLLPGPWLHVQMDAFLEMLPDRYHEDTDGFVYETTADMDGHPVVEVRAGPAGIRLLSGMRRAIAGLAHAGNDIIIDDVIVNAADAAEYDRSLADFRFLKVGVTAPLDILEARERARGDRMIGLARGQWRRVHAAMRYDLEIDSASASAEACARRIRSHFSL